MPEEVRGQRFVKRLPGLFSEAREVRMICGYAAKRVNVAAGSDAAMQFRTHCVQTIPALEGLQIEPCYSTV